jgi:hypothetical protein
MTRVLQPDMLARVMSVLKREGMILSEPEVARIAERYAHCPGSEAWDVRMYASADPQRGGREYRVMRGRRPQDVYSTREFGTAAAVRTALNELEAEAP